MKNLLILICILLLTVILASDILAANYANLKFNGFSEGSNYLAFEESGMPNRNSTKYAKTYFVDTGRNSFVLAPVASELGYKINTP